MKDKPADEVRINLPKVATGIKGLDEITNGGLPQGRPTLITGSAGTGKTLLSLEFLVNGVIEYDEPGVFMAFEETEEELIQNVASLGFDLQKMIEDKRIFVDYVHIERSEIEEAGEYNLDGLFVRLNNAIETVGAKRVVLDTLEALFTGFTDQTILRAELRRLFRWLKAKGVSAIITGEKGEIGLTRHGLEEYVSDCVISLSHEEQDRVYTRRLRIVKYRGTKHETSEFPFLIDDDGFAVMPITSLALDHDVSEERISSGVPEMDAMLGGKGFFRGSSILISGTSGTGKTSLCGHMADGACKRGEKVLYLSFEESSRQIIRNMKSIGMNLGKWVEKKQLMFHSARVSLFGLEAHLTALHKLIGKHEPDLIIIDPINAYLSNDDEIEAKTMLIRLIDFIKANKITGYFTSLTGSSEAEASTSVNISSLMDTWLLLRDIETRGERNRGLYVLKSRGMANSNQIREFMITSKGVKLKDVYLGREGVLTGSSRLMQEMIDQEDSRKLQEKINSLEEELERKEKAMEAQVELIRLQAKSEKIDIMNELDQLKREILQKEVFTKRNLESRSK